MELSKEIVISFGDSIVFTGLYAEDYPAGLSVLDELFGGDRLYKDNVIAVLKSLGKDFEIIENGIVVEVP